MGTPQHLVIPTKREDDVRALLGLTSDQLGILLDEVRGKRLVSAARYEDMARRLGLPNKRTIAALSALRNLTQQRKRYGLDDDSFMKDLCLAFEDETKQLSDDSRQLLLDLTREDSTYEKARDLRYSSAPHMVGARTVCDVRPVFTDDRRDIAGGIVVTVLELDVHDHEKDQYRKLAIQVTEDDLEALRETLADAIEKNRIIRERIGLEYYS